MYFGPIDSSAARGAILAHSVKLTERTLKKGRVLSDDDVAALVAAGVTAVTAARLEGDDIHEDAAAERLGHALKGSGVSVKAPFTGRVNLYAEADGVLAFDSDAINAINQVDEVITLATLPRWAVVKRRQMIATIKIIPFSVPAACLDEALIHAGAAKIAVQAFASRDAILLQTELPSTRGSVLDKTVRVLRARMEALGGQLIHEQRTQHSVVPLASALRGVINAVDLVMIAGASAIVDRRDVIPAAIEEAGGEIIHFGMPVDPGNLILVAKLAGKPVLGLPGCARSPALNGVDLVLQRLAAGCAVDGPAIQAMGVGGLLKEFSGRPTPRAGEASTDIVTAPCTAGVVLAAGQSRRMGDVNKLLVTVEGDTMVRRAVRNAVAAGLDPVIVVTGHEREQVQAALQGEQVTFVHNPSFADGLSTSLAAGVKALPDTSDAVVVCLADMPLLTPRVIERLASAFDPVEGRAICVPTWKGKRGNPILWDARFASEMLDVSGDVGARHLLGVHDEHVCEVAMDDAAVLEDVDSPADLQALAGRTETAEPVQPADDLQQAPT
jgi:molybdenum cofactor cytidylyltransferase